MEGGQVCEEPTVIMQQPSDTTKTNGNREQNKRQTVGEALGGRGRGCLARLPCCIQAHQPELQQSVRAHKQTTSP
jgi:hypothetical protein